jgi:LemA protein
MSVVLIIVVIVALIVLWFISVQRMLVSLDENVNNAMSQIGVNLTSRFDALTGLLDLVKGYNEHEYKTLSDVIKMRTSIGSHSSAAQVEDQENIITQAVGKIMAVAEAYPDLKANTNYQNLMNSLNDYETKVRQSRLVYNDSVTKLNRTIRMFPTSLVAPMCGIVARDYLKVEETKQEMPSMK